MEKPFSFSLTKTVKKSRVCYDKLPDSIKTNNQDRDFVISINNTQIESSKPKTETVKEIVIPLIKSKKSILIRDNQSISTVSSTEIETSNPLLNQALEELKAEAKEWNDESDGIRPNVTLPITNLTIENTDLKEEDSIDAAEADYESVSINDFGTAMLRGMGWKPETNKKEAKLKEIYIRPKGLGLGADPEVLKKTNPSQSTSSSKDGEELKWKTGAYCQIVMGRHSSLYGVIDGFDGNDGRVTVRTTVSKEVFNILQHSVKLVTQEEYKKYSKYINKIQADAYKKVSDERMAQESRVNWDRAEKSNKRLSSDNRPSTSDNNSEKRSKLQMKKKSTNEPIEKYWVLPGIRVRLVDKNFHRGKYYKEKVEVLDVISKGVCNCQTEEGKLIENIPFKYLETVVPKMTNSRIVIVKGEYKGQKGKLVEKRPANEEVVVLIEDDETVLVLTYDDISEKV